MAVKKFTILSCDGCGKEFQPDPNYRPMSFAIAVARWNQFVVALPGPRRSYGAPNSRQVLVCQGCDPVTVATAVRAELNAAVEEAASRARRDYDFSVQPVPLEQYDFGESPERETANYNLGDARAAGLDPDAVTGLLERHPDLHFRDAVIFLARDSNPDGKPPTYDSLGQFFGITRERVRQIHRNAQRIVQGEEAAS